MVRIYTQLHPANDTKMTLIAGHTFPRQIIPLVHNIPHLYAIYILSSDLSKHERWIQRWGKVKGVLHTNMTAICQSLEQVVKQYHQDSMIKKNLSYLVLSLS
jgi:hypothetical protein